MIVEFAAVWLFGVALRALPFVLSGRLGSDQWYWLLYVETYKRERKFPVELPYLLEKAQWYPPAFPLLLSVFPIEWLKRRGRLLAPFIDSLQLFLVGYAGQLLSGDPITGIIAMAVYALTPIAISYNYQLNPRGLAALAFSLQTLALLQWVHTGEILWAAGASCLGVLICMLHKMTTQMMVIMIATISIWATSWEVALQIPIIGGLALLTSGGFYWKVLRAHHDIVTFWNRNRDHLNAHQYYASDLYRREVDNPALLHQPGVKGILRHLRSFLVASPYILVLALGAIVFSLDASPEVVFTALRSDSWIGFCIAWTIAVYTWGALTSFVPGFRCLGAGVFYTYNAALPVALLTGYAVTILNWPGWILAATALISLSLIIRESLRHRSPTQQSEDDLVKILEHLERKPNGNVYCIPFGISELAVYTTRKPVMWGGHGYGLRCLEPYFPVMRTTFESALADHDIRYIVHDTSYVAINEISVDPSKLKPITSSGKFSLYERDTNAPVVE